MIQIPSVVCERCGHSVGVVTLEASQQTTTSTLEMLRQNIILAPDARHIIEQIIRKDNADISLLDREISQLQLTLLELNRQCQAIQTRVDRNKALLAPIHRIPVEILQQIFTLCFPFISTGDIKSLPFQVSHVSAHWRFVASTMPDLWTKIDFDLVTPSIASIKQRLRIYKRFVCLAHDQSGTRPITMSIRTPNVLQDLYNESDSLVSAFSFEFCDRWAEFSIDLDLLTTVQLKGGVNFRLPGVNRLALLDNGRNGTPCFVPNNMTQLTHLKLSRCSVPVIRLVGMPWSQITHLEVHYLHIDDLSAILRQMPTLTHAHLNLAGGKNAQTLQAICLPHLIDLTLSCQFQHLISIAAKSLTTPILSRFRAVVSWSFGAHLVQLLGQTLRAFVDRSSPPITHLGLQYITSQDMKDLLEGLPTVESLDLFILNNSNEIMNQLVWRRQPDSSPELGATNLLPNLQILTVRKSTLSEALPGIIEMIRSRHRDHVAVMGLGDRPRPARLHTVRFRSRDSVSSESMELCWLDIAVDCMRVDIPQLDILPLWPPWLNCHMD